MNVHLERKLYLFSYVYLGVLHEYYVPKHFGSRWHSLHLRFICFVKLFQRFWHICVFIFTCPLRFPSVFQMFNFWSVATLDNSFHSTRAATSSVVVAAHGMFRLTLAPRGPSEHFYQIFVSPLNRHLSLEIILFLVEEDTSWTLDTFCFATTCRFLWLETRRFRQVDTPSVASLESDD